MKNSNTTNFPQAESATYTDLAPRTIPEVCRAKLQAIKTQIVGRLSAEFSDLQKRIVQRAVDEAEALALLTGAPYLLLPTLAEEKVRSARNWSVHQQAILRRSGFAQAA